MKAKSRGLTLVELLVVMVVIGILSALVGPSFVGLLARRAVQAAASDIASDLRVARSEATKRSTSVTVCRSTDHATCAGAGSWHTGWVVFVDRDGDGLMDAGDDILRVHQELSSIRSMGNAAPDLATTRATLTFRPNGLVLGVSGTSDGWVVTPTSSSAASARLVCIAAQGRLTVREQGATAC
jgi:type IV fimbrial biogenesis protein FimT